MFPEPPPLRTRPHEEGIALWSTMKAITIGKVFLFALTMFQGEPSATKTASISGRVVPEYTGQGVRLARYAYDNDGEMKLINVKVVPTSKEIGKFGEFRFDNVE